MFGALDVAFREDDCRVRAAHAGENFAVIRHIAVNLLKGAPSPVKTHPKLGVESKRLFAAGNDKYLFRLFGIHSLFDAIALSRYPGCGSMPL